MLGGSNPSRYREMSKPFADNEQAEKALRAFYRGIEALRVECKIPDLVVAMRVTTAGADGEEPESGVVFTFGDLMHAAAIAAFAYGKLQADAQHAVENMVATGKRTARR
jgi:hypothetical protein